MSSTKSPSRRRSNVDLGGIRQRGGTWQVRVFAGDDPTTGRPVMLTGTATTQAAAVRMRDDFRRDVEQRKAVRTNATLAYLLDEYLAGHEADPNTLHNYRLYADNFIVPALGGHSLTKLARLGPRAFEQLYTELRRCRRRCAGGAFTEHRKNCPTPVEGGEECDRRCRPHVCRPLGASTLRQTHVLLNGAFKAAVRWGWIGVNPVEAVIRPKAPRPRPNPPSADQAAHIIEKAWSIDDDWGTFVWLTMVTGARRGELVALRWTSILLKCAECGAHLSWSAESCTSGHQIATTTGRVATLEIKRGYTLRAGQEAERDTKTHQMRRIALDSATVEILAEHRQRYQTRMAAIGLDAHDDAYLFSYAPDHSKPCNPDGLTHRYSAMTADLGLDTHLHELRHYSATELLAAGVDLRTVAGRLGHGGGGATTLKVYAAWVQSADEQAAALLASRLPSRPDRRDEQ